MFNFTTFDFKAVRESQNLPFASDVDDETVEFIPRQDGHAAIVGAANVGRMFAAHGFLYSAAIKGYEIYVIDPIEHVSNFKFFEPYARAMDTTINDAAATLKAIYADVERRKDLNAKYGTASIADLPDDVRPDPMLVFVNELSSLIVIEKFLKQPLDNPELDADRKHQLRISNDRASIAYFVGKIVREGRSAGVVLIFSMQSLATLDNVPEAGEMYASMSRLFVSYAFAEDSGCIWDSMTKSKGVPVRLFCAPPSRYEEELKAHLSPLSDDQRLDITPFLAQNDSSVENNNQSPSKEIQ